LRIVKSNELETKDGTDIDVNDMTIEHVEKVLQMLIKKYTSFCINHGARYAPQIKLNKMTEQEKRSIFDCCLQ